MANHMVFGVTDRTYNKAECPRIGQSLLATPEHWYPAQEQRYGVSYGQ